MQKIHTFLMFEGQAEEAMNFYVSLFPNSEVLNVAYYGPEGPGAEGSVIAATFTLKGQEYMCIDSNVKHSSISPRILPSSISGGGMGVRH